MNQNIFSGRLDYTNDSRKVVTQNKNMKYFFHFFLLILIVH